MARSSDLGPCVDPDILMPWLAPATVYSRERKVQYDCDGDNDDDDDGANHIVDVELGHHFDFFFLLTGNWEVEEEVAGGRQVGLGAVDVDFVCRMRINSSAAGH